MKPKRPVGRRRARRRRRFERTSRVRASSRDTAEITRAVLASVRDHIAVLDRDGTILSVNEPWRRFAQENGVPGRSSVGVGANYLDVCHRASRDGDETARTALAGIRSVLDRSAARFSLEYPCSSPSQPRWFQMLVLPLKRRGGGAIVVHTETTDHKRADDWLRGLLETSPDATVVVNHAGGIVFVNAQTEHMLGYARDELIGQPVERLLPDRFRGQHANHRRRYADNPRPRRMGDDLDLYARRKDGREFPVEISLSPLHTHEGPLISANVRDITDRKRVQHALRASQERLLQLLETTEAIPWEADAKTWQFTYVGPQAARLLGYPVEQWYQTAFWVDHIHPDDRDYAITACSENARRRTDYSFEYRMIAADGRIVWLYDAVTVVSTDGVPQTLRGFMIDITERRHAEQALRESENQLRVLADSLPVLIAYVDREQRYRFNNAAYRDWIGVEPDELQGKSIRAALGETAYERIRPHVEAALTGGTTTFEAELPFPGLGDRYVQANLVPQHDGSGSVIGVYVLVTDLTPRRRAEQRAQRQQAELAHVARVASMGELAAALAHELNQPLTAILSNAQATQRSLVRKESDPGELNATLHDIVADATRAGEMIRRLRDFLRRGELRKSPLDVNETIRAIEPFVRADALAKNVTLVLHPGPDLPMTMGDRIQLQQVVLNLIRNGADAMNAVESGSRELVVETVRSAPETITVAVRDAGPPISEDALANFFKPFYTTKLDGLGMGLPISRSIIEAHGGRLWAARNADSGITMRFTLPCQPAEMPR